MKTFRIAAVSCLLLTIFALLPASADAQHRRGPRRSVVVVGGVGAPFFYDPWFYRSSWGPWAWGPYWQPYGYGGPYRDDVTATVRIDVEQRDADVYVDGYLAGKVDDFDGVFQRLRVPPGGHEIAIHLDGYRTARRNVYLEPDSYDKLEFDLEPLGSTESPEPPPTPSAVRDIDGPRLPPRRPGPDVVIDQRARFGTLSIRVQPADAEIFIDEERWDVSEGQDRIAIQLAEGRHRVEVRAAGFSTYAEEVLIRSGRTLTLNVSLAR